MSLRPAELGQVTVKIQVNNGMVSLQATGMTAVAVEALREAMPELREDLLRSGLDLVDSHVDRDPSSFGDDDSTSSLKVMRARNLNQLNPSVPQRRATLQRQRS